MFHHDYNISQSLNECDELNQEKSFDLKLIQSVKPYPLLYGKGNKKIHNVQIEQAWVSISESTNKTVEECQTRFKRLREYYSRERQRQKQGQVEIKFQLYKEMSFLAPFTCSRKISQNKVNSSKKTTKNDAQDVDESLIELEFPELDMTNEEQIDYEENEDLSNAGSTSQPNCSEPQINNMQFCNFQDSRDRPLRNITNSNTITSSVAALRIPNNVNDNFGIVPVEKSSDHSTCDFQQKTSAAENEMLQKKRKSEIESKDLCKLIVTRLCSIKDNEKKIVLSRK